MEGCKIWSGKQIVKSKFFPLKATKKYMTTRLKHNLSLVYPPKRSHLIKIQTVTPLLGQLLLVVFPKTSGLT